MAELDDGRTLAQVIELSRATLVVLDKDRVAPFARLYENACCCCCLFIVLVSRVLVYSPEPPLCAQVVPL